jgi:hypothetical protein
MRLFLRLLTLSWGLKGFGEKEGAKQYLSEDASRYWRGVETPPGYADLPFRP